jgi:hypothetical protein
MKVASSAKPLAGGRGAKPLAAGRGAMLRGGDGSAMLRQQGKVRAVTRT